MERQLSAPRHLVIVSSLALMLVVQAVWAIATTSGTYDETTYLRFGRQFYTAADAAPLAEWGIAPLPVLLTTAAATASQTRTYPAAIALMRVSALVLFGFPLVALTYWTLLHALGRGTAVAGTALIGLSPNLVAHASVATTDVCFVAAALATLAALVHHLETPTPRSRILLAVTLAVALASKYSALQLFVIVPLALVMWRSDRSTVMRRSIDAAAFVVVCFGAALLLDWILHAFAMVPFGLRPFEDLRLPAPIVGIARQIHHQSLGEPSFLLGRRSTVGWWYYTPIALAMKSTPAELLVEFAALIALVASWRRSTASGLVWRIAFVVFGAFALLNRIEFGVRYVLVLIPLSLFLAMEWWRGVVRDRRWRVGAVAVVIALQVISAVSITPHDLSYFNSFAGGPEYGYRRLADSNVDWGQDLPALRLELARLGAQHALLSYFGTAPPEAYGIRADRWDATASERFERWDWVAVSATNLDGVFLPTEPFVDFRSLTPDARAGYSIFLYSTARPEVRRAMATAAVRMQ